MSDGALDSRVAPATGIEGAGGTVSRRRGATTNGLRITLIEPSAIDTELSRETTDESARRRTTSVKQGEHR